MLPLRTLRGKILPIIEALDQEVVQPGLETAAHSLATVAHRLRCPIKEPWLLGSLRHVALLGALERFAGRQQGWSSLIFKGIPMYSPSDGGLFLTVKRTPQGRSASSMRLPFSTDEFDLDRHDQQSFLDPTFFNDSPVMHHVALDYVSRPDGCCLTALLLRRGAKKFDPLAYVLSKPALPMLVLPTVAEKVKVGRATIRLKNQKAQSRTDEDE